MDKTLRKAMMLRFKLTNYANKSKDTKDIKIYKQQRYLVADLNKNSKDLYFNTCRNHARDIFKDP